MIWPALVGVTVVVILAGAAARDRWAATAGCVMLVAYVAMQYRAAVMPGMSDAMAALIWLLASASIPRHADRKAFIVRALLSLVAACYLVAKATGAAPVIGSPPYVMADLLAIGALCVVGRDGFVFASGRMRDLGRRRGGRSAGAGRLADFSAEALPEVTRGRAP
jgi:hypothetical protein